MLSYWRSSDPESASLLLEQALAFLGGADGMQRSCNMQSRYGACTKHIEKEAETDLRVTR